MLKFAFTRRINPHFPKVMMEIGDKGKFNSRVRLHITNNERLHFEIITFDYQAVSVSIDITKWNIDEIHQIVGNVNTVSKTIGIYCDSKIVSELKYRFLKISPHFLLEKSMVIGASLEHQYACPFLVQSYSIGDSFTPGQIKSFFEIDLEYVKGLGI